MTKLIHKWTLPAGPGVDVHKMPKEKKFLSSDYRDGVLSMWFEVDDTHEQFDTLFHTVGTGSLVPNDATHVSTYIEHPYVWHVYIKEQT